MDILIVWYGTADKKKFPGRIWNENIQPTISPYVGQVFRAVAAYHSVLTNLANEKKLFQVRTRFFLVMFLSSN